jgi:hypothetical protein
VLCDGPHDLAAELQLLSELEKSKTFSITYVERVKWMSLLASGGSRDTKLKKIAD